MGIWAWLKYMLYYTPGLIKEFLADLPGNIVTGIRDAIGKHKTRFNWDTAVCAPEDYPMELLDGTAFYRGEQSFYIRTGGARNGSWGSGHSTGIDFDKLKLLPDRLKIVFLSYAEKQCYQGEFALPYEKIEAIFRDGVVNGLVSRSGVVLPNYTKMMVGVAPGGVVAVWAAGRRQTEVFFGQATRIACNTGLATDENVAKELADALSPEKLRELKNDGVPLGLWARYRNQYHWLPTFTGGQPPDDIDVYYLNGENSSDWRPADITQLDKMRPVPEMARFMTIMNDKKHLFEVRFDEFEIMAAFERLGAEGKQLYLEFEPYLPRTNIRIRLRNDNETIELIKYTSKA